MNAGQTFMGSYFVFDEDDNITAFELKVIIAVYFALTNVTCLNSL